MSNKKQKQKSSKANKRKNLSKPLLIAGALISVVVLITIVVVTQDSSTEHELAVVEEAPDFDRLNGSWIRSDGGYVIKISDIQPDGQMTAAYYNPRPINVSRARYISDNGILKVFIELRDQGYPGSTYEMKYHPEHDALVGIYYQAAMQQSFDVAFTRKQ